jgi:NADH-quinone oxidoreductase subunit E
MCTEFRKDEKKEQELLEFIESTQGLDHPDSYLIAVMHKVQELYGYLEEESIKVISEKMGVSMSRIWGVATFYHLFNLEPCGKYVMSVCRGTACYVKGTQGIIDTIKKEIGISMGETSEDMMFTLHETRCLGTCALAPAIMINNRIYGELTPTKITAILNKLKAEV